MKVVSISERRIEGRRHEPSDRVMDLQALIWDYQKRIGATWQDLADDANLSADTVRKIASGETKSPHLLTEAKLANALGLRVVYVQAHAVRQPDEIDLNSMRSSIPTNPESAASAKKRRLKKYAKSAS